MTYTTLAISIFSAFASGSVLGGRYLALVLLPASVIVVAAISEASFVLGAGVVPTLVWAVAGLFALQLGYVFGNAALRSLLSADARRQRSARGKWRIFSPPLDSAERSQEPSRSDLLL